MMKALCCSSDVCYSLGEVRCMSHNPSVVFRLPVIINFPVLLCIFRSCFVNVATQSLSHIWPIDTKDELLRSLKICVEVALGTRSGMGRCPCCSDVMTLLFGNRT